MFRTLRSFHRLAPLLREHRGRLAFGLLCLPLHAAVVLGLPVLFGRLLDRLTGQGPEAPVGHGDLAWWCLGLAGLAALESLLRYLSRRAIVDTSRTVEERLKNQLVGHVVELPVAWFDRARTGDLVSRLTQDVELLRFVIGPVLLHGGSACWVVPGGFALMLTLSWQVTLACGVAFAAMFAAMRWLLPRIHRHGLAAQEAIGDLSQRVHEDFAGFRVLAGFAAAPRERGALARHNRRVLVHNLRLTRLRAWVNVLLHLVSRLLVLGVLVVGGWEVMAGQLTVGELFQFVMVLGLMLWPLQALGWSLGTIPRAVAAAGRIEEVLAHPPEPRGGGRPTEDGRLEVRGLTFTYPGQQRPALRNVSFTLGPGGKLGLVGPVGAGKSTLLALCLRFYDPPPGTVFLGGNDVLELDPTALRACFAFAPQDPFLFSDTIAGNVAFGGGGAPADVDLESAVRAAALDQDIDQLHGGLETLVGERGVTLSGGQKQRVSLARAMAADRPALILDDTLSAVDATTERRILERLRVVREGRTMVVATHRLSAVTDADHILVLEAGRVVEEGRHDELVARGGRYAEAWRLQREERALEGPGEEAR